MPIRVLNVAEKPSVAKAVATILSHGRMRTRDGRSRYNRIFEFAYTIGNEQCEMVMTSVAGHLMELEFLEPYRKWHGCDPSALFEAPVQKKVPEDKIPLQKTLEEESRSCQWLVLWLDCDREGENIAYEVMEVCLSSNRRLNVWRARFSALVERDIHAATQRLVRPNEKFAQAVDARQEIDLRIGASFTRFQTLLLQDRFVLPGTDPERKSVLSYGPCQFPTLGFVVERYWQIQAHVSEDFWSIHCRYNDEQQRASAEFTWLRGRLFDYQAAVSIYEMCMDEPMATVCDVNGHEKRRFPPHPLNTVELQKRASRYLRLGSEQTMKIAEELYQSGFLSYPRTETDRFQDGMDLQGMVREQTEHPNWGNYAQRLLNPDEGLWKGPGNGGHDDNAHPPIHPTKSGSGSNWTADHARVYELVVRHFLACVSQPAVGYETVAVIDIAGEKFRARGLMITARNYLDVYRYDNWGTNTIPVFQQGQQFMPTELTLRQGSTEPPPLLSESDLLGLMDQAGIGTDATMHDHIKKLLDRGYATKDSSTRFSPTALGEALVMGYDAMGYELWKPHLRALMERDMRSVSDGAKSKAQVLGDTLRQTKACFLDAREQKEKLVEAMAFFFDQNSGWQPRGGGEHVRPCPVCGHGSMMLKTRQGGGYYVGCAAFPECRNAVWLPSSTEEASVTQEICPHCQPGPVHRIRLKFRRSEIPQYMNAVHLGCVGGCDATLKELIEICGTRSSVPSAGFGQAAGRGNQGPPGRGVRRGGASRGGSSRGSPSSGQSTCTNCSQSGHTASSCPRGSRGGGSVRGRLAGRQRRGTSRGRGGGRAVAGHRND